MCDIDVCVGGVLVADLIGLRDRAIECANDVRLDAMHRDWWRGRVSALSRVVHLLNESVIDVEYSPGFDLVDPPESGRCGLVGC